MNDRNLCNAYPLEFRGWRACCLENGWVRLVAVPAIGGRVMTYDLGPYPFLFVDPHLAGKLFSVEENQGDGTLAAWKNYGGDKTWPAPQGWRGADQWPGPPDPVLDSGHYTLDELSSTGASATIRMVSPPDQRTGVQIVRQFTLHQGSSRVTLNLTFRNVLDRPIRWAIWDVVQLRAECRDAQGEWTHDPRCVITTPINPQSRFAGGFNVMFGAADNPQWQVKNGLLIAPYLWQIGKVGVDSPAGWIAFNNGSEGFTFSQRFLVEPDEEYPDGGATVECWTVGAGQVGNLDYAGSGIYLMESEVLGPLRTIAPGGSTSLEIEWGACRGTGPIFAVSEAGCCTESLTAALSGAYCGLRGSFGVFDVGRLELRWLDATGQALRSDPFGVVDPLSTLHLDRLVCPPAGAVSLTLEVRADTDGVARRLAEARIEK